MLVISSLYCNSLPSKSRAPTATSRRSMLMSAAVAVGARMPASPEQRAALSAYTEAGELLRDWESGCRSTSVGSRCWSAV
jgi:hypothetical protein